MATEVEGYRRRPRVRAPVGVCVVRHAEYEVKIFDPASAREVLEIARRETRAPDDTQLVGLRHFQPVTDLDDMVTQDCYELRTINKE